MEPAGGALESAAEPAPRLVGAAERSASEPGAGAGQTDRTDQARERSGDAAGASGGGVADPFASAADDFLLSTSAAVAAATAATTAGAAKSAPDNFSTPTGIHPLSAYAARHHAAGGGAGSTAIDESRDLAAAFSLPAHRLAAAADPSAVLAPAAGTDAAGAVVGTAVVPDTLVDATGMTVSSEPFAADALGGAGPARCAAATGHISNDAAAAEVMITQGTGLSNAIVIDMPAEPSASHHSDDGSMDDQDDSVPAGRVDASKLEVLENPLSKSDRYTVIKGRLPDSDPFMRAAQNLGTVFMSNEMRVLVGDLSGKHVSEDDRRAHFMRDIEAFNKELNRDFKIPIIGGGQLSLYALALEVMRLGGLKNVVLNRAFRIVGQQLELPKSCTSAAFVLKNAYERLLYLYEQKLAFGINPTNPQRTIDMKSVVSETKRRGSEDRRNRSGSGHRRQQKHSGAAELHARIGKRGSLDAATAKQMEAIRDAAAKELQLADPGGDLLRQGAEEGPDLFAHPGMQLEKLTPQQPESGASAFVASALPESAIPMQDWTAEVAGAIFDAAAGGDNVGLHSSRGEGEADPFQIDTTVAVRPPAAAPPGVFHFDELFSTGLVYVNLRSLD
jgi:hypothetical protein